MVLIFFPLCLLLVSRISCLPAGNATDRSDLGNLVANAKETLADIPNQKIELIRQTSSIIPTLRPFGRERAKIESESILSKPETIYGKAQQFVKNIIHPKPIVDTISEEEKYGNNGDQFRKFNDLIVNGYEGFSNFLNAAVDIPFETMKKITRKASSFFSEIGAKLAGL